jgi:hypothetical protein
VARIQLPDGSTLLPWHELPSPNLPASPPEFEQIVQRLSSVPQDTVEFLALRRLLAVEQEELSLAEVEDDQVAEELAFLVLGGRLVWTSGTFQGISGGGGNAKEDPKPPPPPPPKPKEKVHVTPHLEVEIKVVLFDRGLEKHQEGSDPKYPAEPTLVKCSLTQSPYSPKFEKGANLKVEGAGAVEAYEDEKLTKKFDIAKPIPNDKLTASEPLKLWLKGKTKGKFDLKLEVESASDPFIAEKPVVEKMGVVEIQFALHDQDLEEIKKVQVDPDVDTYYDDLKGKALPDQKALSDEDKIKKGRLLHIQRDGNHGRAKLILKKLAAAEWPDGTDDYAVTFTASESADAAKTGKGLGVCDKEAEGGAKSEVKVSALKGADATLWVEGTACSKKLLDWRLDAGVSGAGKLKRNADWARFTVVQIKEIKLEISSDGGKPVVWDWPKKRFYINTDATPAGRELKDKGGAGKRIKVKAILSEKIKDVVVHFMLAGNKNNFDPAKWTSDAKTAFKWNKLDKALKATDKKDRKDVVHLFAATDADGAALMKDLVLSRLGGEKYKVGAYIAQDPHLAKFVDGHVDLGKRKPVCGDEFTIWRKVWVQLTYNKTAAPVSRQLTIDGFEGASLEYKEVDETKFDKGTIAGLVEHEAWQFRSDGDVKKVICVGNHNKTKFHGQFVAPTADHKPKSHMILCEVQWDPINSGVMTWNSTTNPANQVCTDASGNKFRGVIKPPLNGGSLVVVGTWNWNSGTKVHLGQITDAMVTIDPARDHHSRFKVTLPATCPGTCPCGGGTAIAVSAAKPATLGVQLNAASGPWAGESGSPHCLIVLNANANQFNNTILHEVGHQFNQVRKTNGWLGVPDHPDQYVKRGGQGSHCKKGAGEHATAKDEDGATVYTNGKCIMFHVAVGNVTFCDNCKTDLRVRDMTDFALNS